ncbi:MAG: hypothetical protein NUV35_06460 [Syntrophomonadaceae bacterium]|nr:hypothetical protein [Syntrophomonadaceae bacterium]
MTNFLPAGIINDRLADIQQAVRELEEMLPARTSRKARAQMAAIRQAAEELLEFIQAFPCQPLIYTGKGSTEEVIDRLEWLLVFSQLDAGEFPGLGAARRKRKRRITVPGS